MRDPERHCKYRKRSFQRRKPFGRAKSVPRSCEREISEASIGGKRRRGSPADGTRRRNGRKSDGSGRRRRRGKCGERTRRQRRSEEGGIRVTKRTAIDAEDAARKESKLGSDKRIDNLDRRRKEDGEKNGRSGDERAAVCDAEPKNDRRSDVVPIPRVDIECDDDGHDRDAESVAGYDNEYGGRRGRRKRGKRADAGKWNDSKGEAGRRRENGAE